jgi:Cu-Zn family superoxide dismutase
MTNRWTAKFSLALCAALLTVNFSATRAQEHGHGDVDLPKEAVCVLAAMKDSGVKGTLLLRQQGKDVVITGEISGLKPGEHGFHIHEFGDLRAPDGTSAGPHFNPDGHDHGGPDAHKRHAGDLGNVTADKNGVAKVNVKAEGLMLHFVLGRALVVHADPDDLKSQPSGNAGARIGVGVIGLAEVKKDAPKKPAAGATK